MVGGGVDNKVPQLHATQSEPLDHLDYLLTAYETNSYMLMHYSETQSFTVNNHQVYKISCISVIIYVQNNLYE